MIGDYAIIPLEGEYSPQAIRQKFEARVEEFQRERAGLKTMDGVPVLVGEWIFDGVKLSLKLAGAQIDIYPNYKIVMSYDPTYHVRLNTGEGTRENTASLRGFVELTPRPASGTRALERSSAPTEIQQ